MRLFAYWVLLVNLLILSPSYAVAQSCGSLDDINWLLGDWASYDDEKVTTESWKRIGPQTFEGSGEIRSRSDAQVLSLESLRLVEMSGVIFYVAKVSHNEYPVPFKLTSCSKDSVVFENPNHDFPQRLEYRWISLNLLVVEVSGKDGKGFQIRFTREEGS